MRSSATLRRRMSRITRDGAVLRAVLDVWTGVGLDPDPMPVGVAEPEFQAGTAAVEGWRSAPISLPARAIRSSGCRIAASEVPSSASGRLADQLAARGRDEAEQPVGVHPDQHVVHVLRHEPVEPLALEERALGRAKGRDVHEDAEQRRDLAVLAFGADRPRDDVEDRARRPGSAWPRTASPRRAPGRPRRAFGSGRGPRARTRRWRWTGAAARPPDRCRGCGRSGPTNTAHRGR